MFLILCYNANVDTDNKKRGVYMAKYLVAVYARISREDGDKNESESLVNQRELIKNYVKKHKDMKIVDYYSDDNFTGTNFNRPDFQRMYRDIESGRVNCIIVKDLSRFGRDYIDVGNYIQRIFPRFGVRFIAINDNVDSAVKSYDMITPIKNIFNEQYARDISGKIISTFRNKQESGQFIGAFACYGYKKDPNNKYKLIIDEYPASIVRRIFSMFIEGTGKIKIAKILNEEKILCPSEYKKSIGEKYVNSHRNPKTTYWTFSTIDRILSKEMYIGNMVQHTANCSKFDYTPTNIDKKDWIVVENTHEAIIDKETWNLAQGLLKRRTRQLSLQNNVTKYAGFLICDDCGRAMSKITWKDNVRYVCGTYKRYSSSLCSSHSIKEEVLDQIIISDVNRILSQIKNIKKIVEEEKEKIRTPESFNSNIDKDLSNIEIQLSKIKRLKKGIYEDYKDGLLTKEEFLEYKLDYDKQEDNLNALLNKMKENNVSEKESIIESEFIQSIENMSEITEINRVVLESFYDKIYICENQKIKLKYKFQETVETLENTGFEPL